MIHLNKFRRKLLGLIFVLCLAGCGGDVSTIEFQTIEQDFDSCIILKEPQIFKIDNPDDWADFWTRHKGGSLATTKPIVDFLTCSVIAVIDNNEYSGGYAIKIDSIIHNNGTLQVNATKTTPGNWCGVTGALTQPCHIVQIKKNTLQAVLMLSVISNTPCSR